MRPTRTLAIVAAGLTLGWFASAPPTVPHPPVLSAVAATTSTSAAPPPTTTTAVPPTTTHTHPPGAVLRASRAKPAPRPAPQTAPAPAAPAAAGDCGSWGYKTRAQSDACWGPIIASYGDWPTGRMLAILYCESKGNPWVVNRSNHVGLFQINNSHTKGDGPGNIAHAHGMWRASGTRPWAQCGG